MDRPLREEVTPFAEASDGAPEGEAPAKSRTTIAWVSSTYFAEGLPFMIVRILSSVYFTDVGAKERYIGFLNFLGAPWNAKFAWAPFVDSLGTKRRWMIAAQLLVTLLTAGIAATAVGAARADDPTPSLLLAAALFVGMAFVAATNDVAIDGYYLEVLRDKGDQAAYSGYRVMAYRVAMVFARSGLVEIAAFAGHRLGDPASPYLPWAYAFGAGALTMGLVTGLHVAFLPRVEEARGARPARRPGEVLAEYGRAFTSYLQQKRVGLVLLFIVVYKLGDEILFSMVTPFLLRELHVSKDQFAWIGGVVGASATVVGAMVGGYLIKKRGLARAIWPLTLAMNLNILAYAWIAWVKPDPATGTGLATIAFVHGYEQVAAGIGSAVLLVYILRTCKPEFKAAHYAIGSAIMSLGSTVVGGFGGLLVEEVGYFRLFLYAFCASIPSMGLLFFVPLEDRESRHEAPLSTG